MDRWTKEELDLLFENRSKKLCHIRAMLPNKTFGQLKYRRLKFNGFNNLFVKKIDAEKEILLFYEEDNGTEAVKIEKNLWINLNKIKGLKVSVPNLYLVYVKGVKIPLKVSHYRYYIIKNKLYA